MAGLSQRGVQVGRRKPVTRDNPTREILTESPTAGDGRGCVRTATAATTGGGFSQRLRELPATVTS